jgi:hypothetical protein
MYFFASTTPSTVMALLLLQLLQTNLLLATLSTSFFFFASFQILLFLQTVKNDLLQYYHKISKQLFSPYLCFAKHRCKSHQILKQIFSPCVFCKLMQLSSNLQAIFFSMCFVN